MIEAARRLGPDAGLGKGPFSSIAGDRKTPGTGDSMTALSSTRRLRPSRSVGRCLRNSWPAPA